MKKVLLMAGALMLFALPTQSHAQIGAQVSYGSDSDIGVGARFAFGMPTVRTGLEAIISADYFFPDCGDCTWIEFNGNAALNLASKSLNPYVGAGLNVARVSVDVGTADASSTEVGLNLLGGLKFPGTSMTPFAEAKLTIGGSEQFVISGGILFGKRR